MAIVLEEFSGQSLGEVISTLITGINFDNLELMGVGPKPVPAIQEVACSSGDAMVVGQVEGSLIVFKGLSANGGFWMVRGRLTCLAASNKIRLRGRRTRRAEERATYSASRVDKEIEVWSWDFHVKGQLLNRIT